MENIFKDRISRLREILSLNENEVYFTSKTEDIIYLTGFYSSNAFLFISKKIVVIFTDKRYTQQLNKKSNGIEYRIFNHSWIEEINAFLKFLKIRRILLEASKNSHDRVQIFRKAFKSELKFIGNKLDYFFAYQDNYALDNTKKALRFTEQIFNELIKKIKEGISELDLYAELKYQINLTAANGEAFEPIVLFGKNTAYPHGYPGKTKLKLNMPILLDFGVKIKGYCSDFTRTIFFGKPSAEFIKFYEIVKDALLLVQEKLVSGMKGSELYDLVIKYFATKNLDKFFTHALGHGIGVYIHNYPKLSKNSSDVILPNLILAIEPALYFENRFGIRIENNVYVQKNEIKVLNRTDINLIVI